MNKQESDILNVILQYHCRNQRALAERCGFSLGMVNRSVKALQGQGFLTTDMELTEKARLEMAKHRPKNAVILAAGYGMRMVPINMETPKGLLEVEVARLHIDRYQLQTQLVQPLKEWELDAGFTDQDPLAFLEAGNNKCGIRRRLHITARQNGKNDHHNSDHGNHGCMFEYKFHLVSSLFSADAFRSAFCFCVCVIFTIAFFAG